MGWVRFQLTGYLWWGEKLLTLFILLVKYFVIITYFFPERKGKRK